MVLLISGLIVISYVLKRRLGEKITSLESAQEEMRRSEAKFRAIFDNAPYAIVINDFESGRIVDANPVFLINSGIKDGEETRSWGRHLPTSGSGRNPPSGLK
jgi:PAS domain-containing protein